MVCAQTAREDSSREAMGTPAQAVSTVARANTPRETKTRLAPIARRATSQQRSNALIATPVPPVSIKAILGKQDVNCAAPEPFKVRKRRQPATAVKLASSRTRKDKPAAKFAVPENSRILSRSPCARTARPVDTRRNLEAKHRALPAQKGSINLGKGEPGVQIAQRVSTNRAQVVPHAKIALLESMRTSKDRRAANLVAVALFVPPVLSFQTPQIVESGFTALPAVYQVVSLASETGRERLWAHQKRIFADRRPVRQVRCVFLASR